MSHRLSAALPLVLALLATAVSAQDVRLYRADEAVDPQEVARILSHRAPKMRSLTLLDDAPAKPAGADAGAKATRQPLAVALPVQFAFDSAEIQPDAKRQLDAIAEGIRMLPPGQSVMIEGHTDAVGSDLSNLALSDRRAESVAEILTYYFQIPPENLITQGYGEAYLKVPTLAPERENRRVTLRRITPLLQTGEYQQQQ